MKYSLTALIWKEDKEYVSLCPEIGVSSCGNDIEEASKNLKEAVELYIENATELGIIEDIKPALLANKFTSAIEVIA